MRYIHTSKTCSLLTEIVKRNFEGERCILKYLRIKFLPNGVVRRRSLRVVSDISARHFVPELRKVLVRSSPRLVLVHIFPGLKLLQNLRQLLTVVLARFFSEGGWQAPCDEPNLALCVLRVY